jgi:hypothetical protein
MANKLADALAFQQQRRQALSTADAALADLFGNRAPQPEQPLSTGDYLENLSTGLGRGFESQLEGTYQLARHPIESGKAMYQAGKQVVQNPAMLAEALKSVGQQATSGPLGFGQVAGEYVNPRSLMPKPMIKELDVYHGTPHRFPATEANPLGEFDASKIGTGEGAQAYGHGVYVAQKPEVAQDYQFMLSKIDPETVTYQGKPVQHWYDMAQAEQDRAHRLRDQKAIDRANAKLAYWENVMTRRHPEDVKRVANDPNDGWPTFAAYANSLDMSKFGGIGEAGSLYKADLPDKMIDRMLDWDTPVDEYFASKIIKAVRNNDELDVNDFEDALGISSSYYGQPEDGRAIYNLLVGSLKSDKKASEFLSNAGIPGIKYLDAGSRGAGNSGTRNFVVFPGEEKKVRILERK